MITLADYFMGRQQQHELPQYVIDNATRLLDRVNLVLLFFRRDYPDRPAPRVRSGWRPGAINALIKGAAKASAHMDGQAIDLEDYDGPDSDHANDLALWCLNNRQRLEHADIYMEDPRCTPTWVHWQTRRTASGARFFIPDADWAARLRGDLLGPEDLIG